MKAVLISDTHGEFLTTKKCLLEAQPWDQCFHMGDVGFDPSRFANVCYVRGNHDQSQFPQERIVMLEGYKTWILHGHIAECLLVEKMQADPNLWKNWDDCMEILYDALIAQATQKGCQIVFFGHTHTAYFKKRDGIYLCNPGSLCFSHNGRPPSYATLEITENKVTCTHHFIT